MRKIIFVIPSLEVGGTLSSLTSIIQHMSSHYEINVLAFSHEGNFDIPFQQLLLKRNFLLHAYYCDYSKVHGIIWLPITIVKIVKRICTLFKLDIERLLFKMNISKYSDYEIAIGFQEGTVTRFVSYMQNDCKYAWVHCDYKNYPGAGVELEIYRRFNSIVCVSNYTMDSFVKIYPELQPKVKCVYNLLNKDLVKNMSLQEVLDCSFDNSRFTIISVGRIHKVKRFECIPEIASWLVNMNCRFIWYIVGPECGDKCYLRLLQNIERYKVQEFVRYVGNKLNPYPYFIKSNLLVSLSQTEACPMIFNEAKILNLPVVTTNFGSSYEFISNGYNGVITELHNLPEILYQIITDAEYYKMLKTNMSKDKYENKETLDVLHSLLSTEISSRTRI